MQPYTVGVAAGSAARAEVRAMQFDDALEHVRHAVSSAGTERVSLQDEQWLALLDALAERGLGALRTDLAVRRFAYDGCLQFDRWAVPTPFVVGLDAEERFNRFLSALILLEGSRGENVLTLRVHKLRNEVYRSHAHVYDRGCESASSQTLRRYLNSLEQLPAPTEPVKRTEFDAARAELAHILQGMLDGSVRTVIATRLPYALCIRRMRVASRWQGLAVEILLEPSFQSSDGPTGSGGAIVQPVGSTRWQAGATSVRIELAGLADPDMWTPALRALPEADPGAVGGWPNCFTSAFSMVHDVFWQTREEAGVHHAWPPSPRDVESVTSFVSTNAARELTLKIKRLGMHLAMVNPEVSVVEVPIPELLPPTHWVRCRQTAVSYLALGDTREALLFLNIGVESLLDVRFTLLAEAAGNPEALETILGKKSVWAEAQQIVAKYAPEAVEKIEWPKGEKHMSRFAQIKLAHQFLLPRSAVKEVMRRYSDVSKDRNELVHGANGSPIPVARVMTALASFDWLVDNFVPVGSSVA
jgi:hypothetical protein